jgi:hypothetical protein
LLALYDTMHHWAIIVPPGYTDQSITQAGGNPLLDRARLGGRAAVK